LFQLIAAMEWLRDHAQQSLVHARSRRELTVDGDFDSRVPNAIRVLRCKNAERLRMKVRTVSHQR